MLRAGALFAGEKAMKYRSLIVHKHGGPQVLEVAENELRPPRKGEARIRVLAASISRPDVTARRSIGQEAQEDRG